MLDPIIYVGNIFARYFRCFNQLSPTWEASGKLPTTTLTPSTVNDDFVCPKWSSKIWRQINLTRYLTYFNSKMPPCIDRQSLTMFYHPIEEFMISSWVIQEYCMIKTLLYDFIIFHPLSKLEISQIISLKFSGGPGWASRQHRLCQLRHRIVFHLWLDDSTWWRPSGILWRTSCEAPGQDRVQLVHS